jgi:hypothetical protein
MDESQFYTLCSAVATPFCIAAFAATDYIRLGLRDLFRTATHIRPTEPSVLRRILPLLLMSAAIYLTHLNALASTAICIVIMIRTFLSQKKKNTLDQDGKLKVSPKIKGAQTYPLVGGTILFYLLYTTGGAFLPLDLYMAVLYAIFLYYPWYFMYRVVRTYEERHASTTLLARGLLLTSLALNCYGIYAVTFLQDGRYDPLESIACSVVSFFELAVCSFTLALSTLAKEFFIWKEIYKTEH